MLEGAFFAQRAFLHRGDLPSRCCDAADYTDEWLNDRQRAVTTFAWVGMQLTSAATSSEVMRASACTLTTEQRRQRWYCNICESRYKPKYGVMTEL